ncbi:MAG: sigma-70 family RNA polymerase sigma factor [Acidobacteria bacterium]|nr:sigma-70 family RNA polymerase sigma factor [Acidobacteriota bacterium]MBI1983779.1 sigma-70 family RNA polymerase sigma factor [Acidobacteriota bacterium]
MPTHLENESVLVAKAREGDHDAFTRLIRQYDRHIYRLALNITGNPADAEDVLQDACLKAYEKLGQFHGDSRFYTWLVRIAVNEALMKLRKRRGNTEVSLDAPLETDDSDIMPREIEDWGDTPEQRYAKTQLQEILAEAIGGLEDPYRTVFVLRDIEELSTEETATTLGLSVPAVKSRLLRARLKMRQRLNKYFRKG